MVIRQKMFVASFRNFYKTNIITRKHEKTSTEKGAALRQGRKINKHKHSSIEVVTHTYGRCTCVNIYDIIMVTISYQQG